MAASDDEVQGVTKGMGGWLGAQKFMGRCHQAVERPGGEWVLCVDKEMGRHRPLGATVPFSEARRSSMWRTVAKRKRAI